MRLVLFLSALAFESFGCLDELGEGLRIFKVLGAGPLQGTEVLRAKKAGGELGVVSGSNGVAAR